MGARLTAAAAVSIFALSAACASAQPAPAAPAAPAPFAIPNPNYRTMVLEIDVARPAAQVWARVGKWCAIGEWLQTTCAVTSSGDPERLGAVRVLGLGVTEMLVAKTDLSYTYAQPVRVGVPYNAYHGTMEAKPVTATTSKLIYSFFYDVSMLDGPGVVAAESGRRARFEGALKNMKILAEGGTVPPPAPAR